MIHNSIVESQFNTMDTPESGGYLLTVFVTTISQSV